MYLIVSHAYVRAWSSMVVSLKRKYSCVSLERLTCGIWHHDECGIFPERVLP